MLSSQYSKLPGAAPVIVIVIALAVLVWYDDRHCFTLGMSSVFRHKRTQVFLAIQRRIVGVGRR